MTSGCLAQWGDFDHKLVLGLFHGVGLCVGGVGHFWVVHTQWMGSAYILEHLPRHVMSSECGNVDSVSEDV